MSTSIGTAWIDVQGDFSKLEQRLKQFLSGALGAASVAVEGDFTQLEQQLKQAVNKVGNADPAPVKIDGDAAPLQQETKQAIGEEEGKFKKFGEKLKVGLGAAGLAGGALLAKGLADAMDIEAANDKLSASLGLTSTESKKFGKIAGDLYANAYGDSLEEVNEALKGVVQNVGGMRGASQKELSKVTASVIDVSKALDQDLGGTTAAVGQMMKTGLAKNAKEALDIITVGVQNGADKAGDLLDTFNEYGTQFRKMGLDGKAATGIISQGLKGGARDADLVADAIKEFSIRAIDGSASSKTAYEGLGLSAKKMTDQIAGGGEGAKKGLDLVLDKLRAVEDPAKRAQLATGLFGTQAEDLGAALYDLDPSNAVQTLGKVDGAAARMGDTFNDNAKAKLETFKRQALMGLARGAAELLTAFVPVIDFVSQQLIPAFQGGGDVGTKMAGAMDTLSGAVDSAQGTISAIVTIVTVLWAQFGDDIIAVTQNIGTTIAAVIAAATKILQGLVDFVAGVLTGDWSRAWNGIKSIVSGVFDALKAIIGGALEQVKIIMGAAWEAIRGKVREAWDYVEAKITGAVRGARDALDEILKGITNRLSAAWSIVTGAAGTAWNFVRDKITGALSAARDALDSGENILGGIANRLGAGWSAVRGAAATAWDAVKDKILSGLRDARDGVSGIIEGIGNRLATGFETITKAVSGFAGGIKEKITGAIGDGLEKITGFARSVIGVINKIPGVNISLAGLRSGGTVGADGATTDVPGLARGGTVHMDEFQRGGEITRPLVVVGEEAPKHAEFVVPTNPAYRGRALGLHAQLSKALGVPGYAEGGILGSLPGTDDLPGWLKGTGSYMLKEAASYIKKTIASALGSAFGESFSGTIDEFEKLAKMGKFMDGVDAKNWPYVYGGGHGSFAGPYDCSGLVSAVLHSAGLLGSPTTTDGLKVYGEGGDGEYVTIGVRGSSGRNAHTMMKLGNAYLESGSGHGAKWVDGWSGNFPIHRHPAGLAKGGIFDRFLDPNDPEFLGYGLAQGGVVSGPFVGSYATGGVIPHDGLAYVHAGETVTPAAAPAGSRVIVELRGRALDELIDVRVEEHERELDAAYFAGAKR